MPTALQVALDNAFAHFFRRCALQREGKLTSGSLGYPHRATTKQGLGSFRLTGAIVVFPDAIQLPRLGRLRLSEHGYLPVVGTVGTVGTVDEAEIEHRPDTTTTAGHRPRGRCRCRGTLPGCARPAL